MMRSQSVEGALGDGLDDDDDDDDDVISRIDARLKGLQWTT
jgi:hypothetical protein